MHTLYITHDPVPSRPHIVAFLENTGATPSMGVITQCPMCHKLSAIHVEPTDVLKWLTGQFIQDAIPYLDDDERELLMTGMDTCYDTMAEELLGPDERPDF